MAEKWSRETMAFQQACTRCGVLFLIISLQAASVRAEEAQPKANPERSASPYSSAPSPQHRQRNPTRVAFGLRLCLHLSTKF